MEFKHFSHPHNLRIYIVHQDDEFLCCGCESFYSGSAYGCWECKFFLHERCGNANRSMQHPSHPMHHLTLVPYTTYSAGGFLCNACGDTGNAFSFCCPLCNFDLHVQCATLPQIVKHEAHLHNLSLTCALPHHNGMSQLCNICHKQLDHKFWSYNCFGCNFHVHAYCATKEKLPEAHQLDNIASDATAEPQTGTHKVESASGTNQDEPEPDEIKDPVLKARAELQQLRIQMEMTEALAKMMSSFNLSSLV